MQQRELTAERARELLAYDPETGVVTRRVDSKKGKAKAGDVFGAPIKRTGYREGWVDGKKYLEHRLIWLLVTGAWPAHQVDHRDGARDNNRWANLRELTNGENQMNLHKARGHNKTGLLGVSRSKRRFKAEIRADGERLHIGTFDTPQEAHAAYIAAKSIVHAKVLS